jgi:uracil-DNA glycosylase
VSDDLRGLLADVTGYLRQQQERGTSFLWTEDRGGVRETMPAPPPTPTPTPAPPPPSPSPAPLPAAPATRQNARHEREQQFQAACARFVADALAQIERTRQAAAAAAAAGAEPDPPAATPPVAPAQVNLFAAAGLEAAADPAPPPAAPDPAPAAVYPEAALDPPAALEVIANEVRACTRCALHGSRTQAVPGSGNPLAGLVLIGEAPGQEEDRQGLPFVGRSGQLLTDILRAIGFAREDVFICNILKCRPPGNRDPQREEAAACTPYLERQLAVIRPRLILCLGRIAAQRLLGTDASLGSLRQSLHFLGTIPVLATFHPAALLRNPAQKRDAWDDVRKARALYDALAEAASP